MRRPIVYITPTLQHDFLARQERLAQFEQEAFQEQERSMGGLVVMLLVLGVLLTFCAMILAVNA